MSTRTGKIVVLAVGAAGALVLAALFATRTGSHRTPPVLGPAMALASEGGDGQQRAGVAASSPPRMSPPAGSAAQGSASDAGESPSFGERFARAKALIEFSTGDSVGATREGLEAAAHEIEQLLRGGYSDRKGAYLELADAYNALAFMPGDASMRARYRPKEADAYRELQKLEPNNPTWSFEYAMALDDDAARLDALLQTIAKAPQHAMARLIAGGLQIDANRVEEGAQNLLAAARAFSPAEARADGNDVVNRLNRLGRASDAEAARAAIDAAIRRGVGLDDPE